MRILHSKSGKEVNINVTKYRVNWDGKCRSNVQFDVKQFFRQFWECDNCFEEFPVVGTKLSCDFINFDRNFAVETDGKFHDKFSKFHHKTRGNYINSIVRDENKDRWLEEMGFFVIRIREDYVKNLSVEWIKEKFGVDITDKYEHTTHNEE